MTKAADVSSQADTPGKATAEPKPVPVLPLADQLRLDALIVGTASV